MPTWMPPRLFVDEPRKSRHIIMRGQTGYGEAGLQEDAKDLERGNGETRTRSGRRRRLIAYENFLAALRLRGVTRGR